MLCEAGIMFFGLTVRFLQDTFWCRNIPLVRASGLWLAATITPMLLLGLYASFGIGEINQYHIERKWFWLLIPVAFTIFIIVTDEQRHFVFFLDPSEAQPNLMFHPYYGTFLLTAFGVFLMVIRVILIYKRNKGIQESGLLRFFIPCIEPILMVIFSFPYFMISLNLIPAFVNIELIELFAKIYYMEILTWEFDIYMGLVPVNTEYQSIFEKSTVGMQLIGSSNRLASHSAACVSSELLEELKEKKYVALEDGLELHLHKLSDGYFLWNKDISLMTKTIDELKGIAEQLDQEGLLLREELRTKNEEAGLSAKNQIYDTLSGEVAGQLRKMKDIIANRERGADQEKNLCMLYLLGTYVKRRCNLRLIEQETGAIETEDLIISLENMVQALNIANIRTVFDRNKAAEFSSDFSIFVFDILEKILEYEMYLIDEIRVQIDPSGSRFEIIRAERNPHQEAVFVASDRYSFRVSDTSQGYIVDLFEGGDANVDAHQ
ncbi:MAG: hypothetical protein IKF22_09240, partial [Lachnospiraceae bacterium]|nr:hypothetical protein [Lachnospiraceae bacterium]